jgi:hypothetical protein
MWKAATGALLFSSCVVGCDQQQRQPQGFRGQETEKQSADSATRLDPDRFVGRDGRAEALADTAAGKPPKLYWHVFDGVAPGERVPGIVGCGPRASNVVRFEIINELNFSEGRDNPLPHATNAYSFAADFNRTMFKANERRIKQVCPNAEVE